MKQELQALYDGQKNIEEVYNSLVPQVNTHSLKRARYVKMRIILPEESTGLNIFLKMLFGLPLPMSIARFILRKAMAKASHPKLHKEELGLDFHDLDQLIKYSRGTTISIDSKDAKIRIKIR